MLINHLNWRHCYLTALFKQSLAFLAWLKFIFIYIFCVSKQRVVFSKNYRTCTKINIWSTILSVVSYPFVAYSSNMRETSTTYTHILQEYIVVKRFRLYKKNLHVILTRKLHAILIKPKLKQVIWKCKLKLSWIPLPAICIQCTTGQCKQLRSGFSKSQVVKIMRSKLN